MMTLTKIAALILLSGAALAAPVASAQTPYTDDTVYQGLGGKDGIKHIVDTFIPMVLADARIKDSFADFDMQQLAVRLGEQFCEFSGAPPAAACRNRRSCP